MKKVLKIASIVHIVVWIVILAVFVVYCLTYVTPPDYNSFDKAIEKAIFNIFVGLGVLEILNSALLSACLHTLFDLDVSKLKILKNTALCFSVLSNLLLYLSVCLIFAVDRDGVLVVPVTGIICMLASLVLLIVLKVKIKMIGKAEES